MRYIVHKEALDFLDLEDMLDAVETLSSDKTVTNECLHFYNLPLLSVDITEEQAEDLKSRGILCKKEDNTTGIALAGDYEKVRSRYIKNEKRGYTGVGCKVAVLDTGCWPESLNIDYWYNFANSSTDVKENPDHGNFVTSIVKSSIGLANGADVRFLKVFSGAFINESALLAAVDYCIDNQIDIVNMSFTFFSEPFNLAVEELMASGSVIAAATGNFSTSDVFILHPAALPGVVAVNSVKEDGGIQHRNVLPYYEGKGVTIACSGQDCEGVGVYGQIYTNGGTSFSCPFFCGVFALYKEQTKIQDNYVLLEYILSKAKKTNLPLYFGRGWLTF